MDRSTALRAIAEVAEKQWGLISARQAAGVGVGRVQLARLAQAELLVRLSHGVYRLSGAPEPQHQSVLAAWLALVDPDARAADLVIGGVAAAQLHGIGQFWMREIDLLAPERRRTRREGVRLRKAELSNRVIATVHGVPALTAASTIADLLDLGESPDTVADAAMDALELGITTAQAVADALVAARVDPQVSRLFTDDLEHRLRRQSSPVPSPHD